MRGCCVSIIIIGKSGPDLCEDFQWSRRDDLISQRTSSCLEFGTHFVSFGCPFLRVFQKKTTLKLRRNLHICHFAVIVFNSYRAARSESSSDCDATTTLHRGQKAARELTWLFAEQRTFK